MRAASAAVRTKIGPLRPSHAQRSQSRSSGSALAETITDNIDRGATEDAGCILIPAGGSPAGHAYRLHRSRKRATYAEVPARRLRQG
jgi:hypothetical protein